MRLRKNIIIILSLLCFSCASMQDIYTIKADYGQLFFIRPTKVKTVPRKLKSFDFDITLKISNDREILDDPVLNYTFTFSKDNYTYMDNTDFYFTCSEKKIRPQNSEVVYREIIENKDLEVRYTSTINKEDFLMLIQMGNPRIYLCVEDDYIEKSDKVFSEKIKEIGVLIIK